MQEIEKNESGLPIRWVNESGWDAGPGSTISWLRIARDNGLTVANATRFLPGAETWEDTARSAMFCAMGDIAQFGDTWRDLDARELRLTSNKEVLRSLIIETHRRGYSDRIQSVLMESSANQIADLANSMIDMPFFPKDIDLTALLADADWSAPED